MDNAIGLGIILTLRDRASAGLDSIRNRLSALRDVSQDMMKRFDEGAKQMIAGFASMAAGAKVLGMINKTFGVSVDVAADFEQAMAKVRAVSGAAGEDFEKLTKQARDLGRDTQYSATQVANSQKLLARAGFKTNEIISAMPNLLYMAGAEGMDLASAVDIAANTIRGFGLEASDMERIANVLAKTSSMTNTSISTLGESFKKLAPYAKAVGIPLEEAAAMIGVIGDVGIKGEASGTAIANAIRRLATAPKAVEEALKSLGISAKDTEGNFVQFDTLMERIYAKISDMGNLDQMNILSRIFGGISGSSMLALMNATVSGKLKEKTDELIYNVSDAAKNMYDIMSATMQGAQKRLESATEGMRIAIGNHLLPVYTKAIDLMAQFKSWLTQLIEEHPIISKAVIGLTTALLALSGVALILVGGLASIGGFVKMWPLLRRMAVLALSSIRAQARMALASLSGLSVPVIGMITLAATLYYAWRKNLWGIRDMVEAVAQGFRMAWSASVVRQFWNGLVKGFKDGVKFLMGIFDWMKDIFAPVIESGQELLKFLGILQPVAETQAETWRAWGEFIGRIAPAVITVIAAFKGMQIILGIVGSVGTAILGLFGLIMAHPVVAVIVALVAAGIYLYNHWDEITEDLA